jgi:hypothetical protein
VTEIHHHFSLAMRFWHRMEEIYGALWISNYGTKPSIPWRDVLDRYTGEEIAEALEILITTKRHPKYPPSAVEWNSLCFDARTKRRQAGPNPNEQRRGYWRSVILHHISKALGYDLTTFEAVLITNTTRDEQGIVTGGLGFALRELLNEMDTQEAVANYRSEAMERHAQRSCDAIALAYRHLRKTVP